MGAEARARAATADAMKAAQEEHLAKQPPYTKHQLVDRYGFPILSLGNYALTTGGAPLVGQVVDIQQDLRPSVPPDSWIVTVVVSQQIHGMSRAPMRQLQFIAGSLNSHIADVAQDATAPNADDKKAPGAPVTDSGLILSNPDAV